ncbi:MAG: hypothetical protein QNJ22_22245 [Desulfosarcinaceae bacterium]|nr:hypothetical protein [Desulfosarcinaceae bacterium]
MTSESSDNSNHEWEERTLCSDEACIGIIGPDGRCNECGKPYAGNPDAAVDGDDDDLALASDDLLDIEDAEPADEAAAAESDEDDDGTHWEERILCRDESCIGVIGSDGRCKECGLPLDADED